MVEVTEILAGFRKPSVPIEEGQKPLTYCERAEQKLLACGFHLAERSHLSESKYYRLGHRSGLLRVSDHRLPRTHREKRFDPIWSYITFAETYSAKDECQIDALIYMAVGKYIMMAGAVENMPGVPDGFWLAPLEPTYRMRIKGDEGMELAFKKGQTRHLRQYLAVDACGVSAGSAGGSGGGTAIGSGVAHENQRLHHPP